MEGITVNQGFNWTRLTFSCCSGTLAVEGEDKDHLVSQEVMEVVLANYPEKATKTWTIQSSFGIQECFHSDWSCSNIGRSDFRGNVFLVGDISMTLNDRHSISEKYWKTFS